MTAENKFVIGHTAAQCAASFDSNHLAVVLVLLFVDVSVPLRISVVRNLNTRRIDVERQGIRNLIQFHIVFLVLVKNLAFSVDRSDNFVEFHLVKALFTAVKYHHFSAFQLVEDQLPHILIIYHKGLRVGEKHLLIGYPFLRHVSVNRIQSPHTVILDDNPLYSVLFLQSTQSFLCQILFLFNPFDKHIGAEEFDRMILFLPLFTEKQQGSFSGIKVVTFQRLLNKGCLSALQKSRKQIYWYFHNTLPYSALLQAKQFFNAFFLNSGTDDTQHASYRCASDSYIRLTGYIVKVNPLPIFAFYNALCAKHLSIHSKI